MGQTTYTPKPLDLSKVQLPDELNELVELMAKNVHEVWAKSRIEQGWTYGPVRDDAKRNLPGTLRRVARDRKGLRPQHGPRDSEAYYERGLRNPQKIIIHHSTSVPCQQTNSSTIACIYGLSSFQRLHWHASLPPRHGC